jgi:hypothetical protein
MPSAPGANTLTTLDGFYKRIYGDSLTKLIPDNAKILKKLPFERRKKLGDEFHIDVALQNEQGFTYNTDGSAFALNGAIPMATKPAKVKGTEILLQSRMSYKAASAATSSKEAFAEATTTMFENMMDSASDRLEISLLYGRAEKGKINSTTAIGGSTTTCYVNLVGSSWSVGMWSAKTDAKLTLYTSAGVLIGSEGGYTIKGVDIANKRLLVSASSGDITSLTGTVFTTNKGLIQFYGMSGSTFASSNEFLGIDKVITETTDLFGINPSVYPLWKGIEYTVANGAAGSNPILIENLRKAVDIAFAQGLKDDITAYASPNVFTKLTNDLMANRRFDSSYGPDAKQGFKTIQILASNGIINLEPHPIVKEGEVFMLNLKNYMRVGSTDFTMETPGVGGKIFFQLDGYAGFEVRMYTDQAILCTAPARSIKVTGFDLP